MEILSFVSSFKSEGFFLVFIWDCIIDYFFCVYLFQASPDAVQLVKKYHKQWNLLKRSINTNIDGIKKSIWKLDPNNLEMSELN